MIGFGFMDNLVMIQAGEAIDSTIGVAFGLATMTSAAFGQIVSQRLKCPLPRLTTPPTCPPAAPWGSRRTYVLQSAA